MSSLALPMHTHLTPTLSHTSLPRRPRITVWKNRKGVIFSSPMATAWPSDVGEDGPDDTISLDDPYKLGWAIRDQPFRALYPCSPLPNVGILKSISPIRTAEEALVVDAQGSYKPRRSAEWSIIERRLVDIAGHLYSRHAFHFDPSLDKWSAAGVPSWWNMKAGEEEVALRATRLEMIRLTQLCACVSLFCAIAWVQTGEPDKWMETLMENGMDKSDDRRWLESLKATFVGKFSHVARTGVFIKASSCPWPRLLDIFVQTQCPVFICWGDDASLIPRLGDEILAVYQPSPEQIAGAISIRRPDTPNAELAATRDDMRHISSGSKTLAPTMTDFQLYWRKRREMAEDSTRVNSNLVDTNGRKAAQWKVLSTDSVFLWERSRLTGEMERHPYTEPDKRREVEAHDADQKRYDPTARRWDLFPSGTLPIRRKAGTAPRTVEDLMDIDEDSDEENYDHPSWPPFYDSADWDALCGKDEKCSVDQYDAERRGGGGSEGHPFSWISSASTQSSLTPGVKFIRRATFQPHEDLTVRAIHQSGIGIIRNPSVWDVLLRTGFSWRRDQAEKHMRKFQVRRTPLFIEAWDDSQGALDASHREGPATKTPLQFYLDALGVETATDGLVGQPQNEPAIATAQLEALGLSDMQVTEIIDFLTRLANTGRMIGVEKDSGGQNLTYTANDFPAVDNWFFAPGNEGKAWTLIRRHNLWMVEDAEYLVELPSEPKKREWHPCYILTHRVAQRPWSVVIYNSAFVVQVLFGSPQLSTPDALVLFCLETGIKFNTAQKIVSEGLCYEPDVVAERRARLTLLRGYKMAYRPPKYMASCADYERYMEDLSKVFEDRVIARTSMMTGSMPWRLSVEHVVPEVVLDGPSPDALDLGIGRRFRVQRGNTWVHMVDDVLSPEVETYIVGGYYENVGHNPKDLGVLRTCHPTTAIFELCSPGAGWDAQKESLFRLFHGEFQKPSTKHELEGGSAAQPKNTSEWRSALRHRNKLGRQINVAAEVHARIFLRSRANHEYLAVPSPNRA